HRFVGTARGRRGEGSLLPPRGRERRWPPMWRDGPPWPRGGEARAAPPAGRWALSGAGRVVVGVAPVGRLNPQAPGGPSGRDHRVRGGRGDGRAEEGDWAVRGVRRLGS